MSDEELKSLCNWMIDNLSEDAYEKWLIAYGEILRLKAIESK